jgi:hypothetical protein
MRGAIPRCLDRHVSRNHDHLQRVKGHNQPMSGPADKPASKPFGVANILTSSEKAKRKQDADAGRSNTHLHDYVVGNLLQRRQWVDHRDRNVERAEEQSRRYTVLLMEVRQACPTWTSEAVREEALRLIRREQGGAEAYFSYLPKAKVTK